MLDSSEGQYSGSCGNFAISLENGLLTHQVAAAKSKSKYYSSLRKELKKLKILLPSNPSKDKKGIIVENGTQISIDLKKLNLTPLQQYQLAKTLNLTKENQPLDLAFLQPGELIWLGQTVVSDIETALTEEQKAFILFGSHLNLKNKTNKTNIDALQNLRQKFLQFYIPKFTINSSSKILMKRLESLQKTAETNSLVANEKLYSLLMEALPPNILINPEPLSVIDQYLKIKKFFRNFSTTKTEKLNKIEFSSAANEKSIIKELVGNEIKKVEPNTPKLSALNSIKNYVESKKRLSANEAKDCEEFIHLIEQSKTTHSFFTEEFFKKFKREDLPKAIVLQLIENKKNEINNAESKDGVAAKITILAGLENYVILTPIISEKRTKNCKKIIELIDQDSTLNKVESFLNVFKNKLEFEKGTQSKLQDEILKNSVLALIKETREIIKVKENCPQHTLILDAMERYVKSEKKLTLKRADNCKEIIIKITTAENSKNLVTTLRKFFSTKRQFEKGVQSKLQNAILKSSVLALIEEETKRSSEHASLLTAVKGYISKKEKLSPRQIENCIKLIDQITSHKEGSLEAEIKNFFQKKSQYKKGLFQSSKLQAQILSVFKTIDLKDIKEQDKPYIIALLTRENFGNQIIENQEYDIGGVKLKFTEAGIVENILTEIQKTPISIDSNNIHELYKPFIATIFKELEPGGRITKNVDTEINGFKFKFTHSIEKDDLGYVYVLPGKGKGIKGSGAYGSFKSVMTTYKLTEDSFEKDLTKRGKKTQRLINGKGQPIFNSMNALQASVSKEVENTKDTETCKLGLNPSTFFQKSESKVWYFQNDGGECLRNFIEAKKDDGNKQILPYAKLVKMLVALLKQADTLQKAGRVAMDIKPDNIVYDATKDQTKIIDHQFTIPIQDAIYRGTPKYAPLELKARSKTEKDPKLTEDQAIQLMLFGIAASMTEAFGGTGTYYMSYYKKGQPKKIRKIDTSILNEHAKSYPYTKPLIDLIGKILLGNFENIETPLNQAQEIYSKLNPKLLEQQEISLEINTSTKFSRMM